MEKLPELPYEENEESFNAWFRSFPEWKLFIEKDEAKDGEQYSGFLSFLWEKGTQEEVEKYLQTLRKKGKGRIAMNMEQKLA